MEDKRSINYVFLGIGYGGCRVASTFYKEYGYDAYAINTTDADLGKIPIPRNRKLLLKHSIGGAGKDIKVGERIFAHNKTEIRDFIKLHKINRAEYVIVCIGGGGGSGTGGSQTTARIVRDEGVEVGLIVTLPLESEDTETKKNVLVAIKEIYESDIIKPIVIVDNAKISKKYPNLSIADFWLRANKDIAQTFHLINKMSSQKGLIYSLDSADYRKIIYTRGCSVMGETSVKEFQNKSKLADGLKSSISQGLYASDFDLGSADKVGIVLRGAPSTFKKIAERDISYAFNYIKEVTRAKTIYWGIYADHAYKDRIRVHSIFSGLDLPTVRLQELITEAKSEMEFIEVKRETKKAELDLGFFFNQEDNATNTIDPLEKLLDKEKE